MAKQSKVKNKNNGAVLGFEETLWRAEVQKKHAVREQGFRVNDEMMRAARSGKQNIAEGWMASSPP